MKVTQEVFKTTRDQLVVLIPELKRETEGGILIPESQLKEAAKDRMTFYEVIERGNEVKEVQVGDFVLVARYTELPSSLVQADNEKFVVAVCREYDVTGYVEG